MSGFQVDLSNYPVWRLSVHPTDESVYYATKCDILKKLRVSVPPCALIKIRMNFNCDF